VLRLAARLAPPLTLLVLALAFSPAVAVPGAGCLPSPLPTGPSGNNPSYGMEVKYGSDRLHVALWREQCQDSQDFALLMRATPVSASSLFCPARWYLDQDFSRFEVTFTTAIVPPQQGTAPVFCETLFAPVTVILAASGLAEGAPNTFDPSHDFELIYYGATAEIMQYVVYRLEVPYPPSALPPPPGSTLPTIRVVATRCNPCRSGQIVGFEGRVQNPGPAMAAEVKAGARLPNGTLLSLFNSVVTLPSGPSVLILLPPQALPMGLPSVNVLVEAAILEPVLGATLSRHGTTLELWP
jgi:hypothetical protein